MDFMTKLCLIFACVFTVLVNDVCAYLSPDIGPKLFATFATWGYAVIVYRLVVMKNKEE